jgi:hypothetical protein
VAKKSSKKPSSGNPFKKDEYVVIAGTEQVRRVEYVEGDKCKIVGRAVPFHFTALVSVDQVGKDRVAEETREASQPAPQANVTAPAEVAPTPRKTVGLRWLQDGGNYLIVHIVNGDPQHGHDYLVTREYGKIYSLTRLTQGNMARYIVTMGTYTCSCDSYKHSKETPRTCKHLGAMRKLQADKKI